MRIAHAAHAGARLQAGFAYLFVLLFMALFGAISAGIVAGGSNLSQRAAEEELLLTGTQFREAIRSYYEAGAGGRRFALTFEELLRDPRIPGVRRHLRRVYPDPLTGTTDWGILQAPDGGIMGVYSKSAAKPLKLDLFPQEYQGFANKEKHSEWVFAYVPPAQALPFASLGSPPQTRASAQPPLPSSSSTPSVAPPTGSSPGGR